MFRNIHSSFICNSPKLETTQMSVSRRMDKQTVIHPYNKILCSNKEEGTTDKSNNMDESHKHNLSESSQTQKAMYCMIRFI